VRLTQFTDYGLRVLMYLATRDGAHVTTEEIAGLFQVSWNHLLKVVHRLCELGYVEAKRGPQGGVRLLPGTWDVSVGEVVRNLEAQLELVECFDHETNTCPITAVCRLAPLLERASGAFLRELDQVRVRDLVSKPAEIHDALRVLPSRARPRDVRRGARR